MYCKFNLMKSIRFSRVVLIVAKCIVNSAVFQRFQTTSYVLIVAKCIVNLEWEDGTITLTTY